MDSAHFLNDGFRAAAINNVGRGPVFHDQFGRFEEVRDFGLRLPLIQKLFQYNIRMNSWSAIIRLRDYQMYGPRLGKSSLIPDVDLDHLLRQLLDSYERIPGVSPLIERNVILAPINRAPIIDEMSPQPNEELTSAAIIAKILSDLEKKRVGLNHIIKSIIHLSILNQTHFSIGTLKVVQSNRNPIEYPVADTCGCSISSKMKYAHN